MHNRHVVQCIDSFENMRHIVIVMKLFDMSLRKYCLKMDKILIEEQVRSIFRMIAKGVEHCHQLGVMHLDLKPENILVKVDNQMRITDLCIADFGIALE